MNVRPPRRFPRALSASLCGSLLLASGGCTIFGTLGYVVFGPPETPAKYVPPKAATLVLVEDYRSPGTSQIDADQLARQVGDALKDHAALPVVDPDKLVPLREDDVNGFRAMSIPAIGRAVGAKQVVYVDLLESETSNDPTGGAVHSMATARVRIVDVATQKTLWPAGSANGFEVPENVEYDRSDPSKAASMRTEMLTKLSTDIAKLFYKWKPDTDQEAG